MTHVITVLTSVYLNTPERWEYLVDTITSFQQANQSKMPLRHVLLDHGSPLYGEKIPPFCKQHGIEFLGRLERSERQNFSQVYFDLIKNAETELVLYLEPDHYFFKQYDFISPAVKLFEIESDLVQLFLRAPLVYQQFALRGDALVTLDGAELRRVLIDGENTGWVGKGDKHETFSLMPSLLRRSAILAEATEIIPGGPLELEDEIAARWRHTHLVGYLNGQAFSYHIGAVGGIGGGSALHKGDIYYEALWGQKIL